MVYYIPPLTGQYHPLSTLNNQIFSVLTWIQENNCATLSVCERWSGQTEIHGCLPRFNCHSLPAPVDPWDRFVFLTLACFFFQFFATEKPWPQIHREAPQPALQPHSVEITATSATCGKDPWAQEPKTIQRTRAWTRVSKTCEEMCNCYSDTQ